MCCLLNAPQMATRVVARVWHQVLSKVLLPVTSRGSLQGSRVILQVRKACTPWLARLETATSIEPEIVLRLGACTAVR